MKTPELHAHQWPIGGMCTAGCARTLEQSVAKLPGVVSANANFAAGSIPAIRLVAGFDDPAANLRLVLTPADTRDKVAEADLRRATLLTAAIVAAACDADPAAAATWRSNQSP